MYTIGSINYGPPKYILIITIIAILHLEDSRKKNVSSENAIVKILPRPR